MRALGASADGSVTAALATINHSNAWIYELRSRAGAQLSRRAHGAEWCVLGGKTHWSLDTRGLGFREGLDSSGADGLQPPSDAGKGKRCVLQACKCRAVLTRGSADVQHATSHPVRPAVCHLLSHREMHPPASAFPQGLSRSHLAGTPQGFPALPCS